MSLTIRDTLTPDLRKKLRKLEHPRPILKRMAALAVEMGRSSFSRPELRPEPWAPRKGNPQHKPLLKSTTLRRSLRVTSVTKREARIGSDRKYAAIHQLGGKTRPHIIRARHKKALNIPGIGLRRLVRHPGSKIPARPYLPFHRSGAATARLSREIENLITIELGK